MLQYRPKTKFQAIAECGFSLSSNNCEGVIFHKFSGTQLPAKFPPQVSIAALLRSKFRTNTAAERGTL